MHLLRAHEILLALFRAARFSTREPFLSRSSSLVNRHELLADFGLAGFDDVEHDARVGEDFPVDDLAVTR